MGNKNESINNIQIKGFVRNEPHLNESQMKIQKMVDTSFKQVK